MKPGSRSSHALLAAVAAALACAPTLAWDAHGHRVVTALALDGVGRDPILPDWLKQDDIRRRTMYQSAEPDRWRGQRTAALVHENNPDHYIDIEDLELVGLTLRTVPPLRNEYIRVMAVAMAENPGRFTSYDPAGDPYKDRVWPGFLPHAILEHYAKLQASFRTLRTIEAAGTDGRTAQVEQARANVVYHIGVLSHFVGDAAQPLHTTRHFNGWIGDNPHGYTTSNRFHAYIDGGVLDLHKITHESLRAHARSDLCANGQDPWPDILDHIERSFAHVEDLYRMEKDGTLDHEPGRRLIEERLLDGGAMLYALIRAAWETSDPDDAEVKRFMGWTPAE